MLGQPDLLDRAIRFILPRIPESKRRDMESLRVEFEAVRPHLFGAILDALVGILRHLPDVRIKRLPRMADSCRWSGALEMHLGWPTGAFMRAYKENRRAASLVALDENVLVRPIKCFLELNRGYFEGTASALLRGLNLLPYSWIEDLRRNPDWPRKPNRFLDELRRIGPYLEEAGITIERRRDGKDSTRQRLIVLRRLKRRLSSKRVAQPSEDEADPLVVRPKRSTPASDPRGKPATHREPARSESKRFSAKPKSGSRPL